MDNRRSLEQDSTFQNRFNHRRLRMKRGVMIAVLFAAFVSLSGVGLADMTV